MMCGRANADDSVIHLTYDAGNMPFSPWQVPFHQFSSESSVTVMTSPCTPEQPTPVSGNDRPSITRQQRPPARHTHQLDRSQHRNQSNQTHLLESQLATFLRLEGVLSRDDLSWRGCDSLGLRGFFDGLFDRLGGGGSTAALDERLAVSPTGEFEEDVLCS